MGKFISQCREAVSTRTYRVVAVLAVAVASVAAFAGPALATESAAETSVKALAEKIGSEGVAIFLIAVTGISALIAVIVGVNLGVKKLKSFAK